MNPENVLKIQDTVTPGNLEEALQQAINLEIATIPTYLYTYYSLKRSWAQGYAEDPNSSYDSELAADQKLVADKGNPMGLNTAKGLQDYIQKHGNNVSADQAKEMAIDIQVYANESAALIMSVVIEEMLHMALSSNVKQAIYGPPDLMGGMPTFPAYLAGHDPYFPINAAKFSQAQLETFLLIESPLDFSGAKEKGNAIEYTTIGEFYRMMQKCVLEHFPGPYQNERPQLLPGKGFYGPNSINTVYYDRDHNPQYPGADDSGNLRHVFDCQSAIAAMEEVVEQGEGNTGGDHLAADGSPKCPSKGWDNPDAVNPEDYDDKEKKELSHFDRFLKLWCQGKDFITTFNNAGLDFHSFFVHDLPDNPLTEQANSNDSTRVSYDSNPYIVATSKLINGLYSYLFLMVETCYYQKDHVQYEVFMMGVHKTMIWALSSMCNEVTSWTVVHSGKTYNVGPTFEPNYFKDSDKSPKQQLADMQATIANMVAQDPAYKNNDNFQWVLEYINDFPDVGLDHSVKKSPLLTSLNPPYVSTPNA